MLSLNLTNLVVALLHQVAGSCVVVAGTTIVKPLLHHYLL
jgi:hypothetical protein